MHFNTSLKVSRRTGTQKSGGDFRAPHLLDRVEDGQAQVGLSTLAWGDSAHQLGAIVQRLLAVERTLDSREREGGSTEG